MYKIEIGNLIGEKRSLGIGDIRTFEPTSVEFIEDAELDAKMKELTGFPIHKKKTAGWDGFFSTEERTQTIYLDKEGNQAFRVYKLS